ncbi:MAG: tetratricopeptide repeat protein [Verrucomicrobiales bacterium]|nr:tetratricopeptide repeat protein [Verrucomicrobiales bacterium]MCP5525774.1 tetratricopeptide repeat protein [Verrucomicrobiales bacterium]
MKRSLPANHDASGSAGPPVRPPSPRRRLAFRLLAAVAVPQLLLAAVEFLLRLAGVGHSAGFLIPHPATSSGVLVENQRFPWSFFPRTLARHPQPLVVKPAKPPGVCRLVILGESAAEGDPAPAFGFGRILQVLLEARHPGTRFEVVNTAFTAINSHAILPIARDCRQLDADFWLVYMGNNEVIGPFGAGTVFGQQAAPLPLVRAGLALKSTRLGQTFDGLRERLAPNPEARSGWGGMTMFQRQQVRHDDPRLPGLRANFGRNLADIVAAGRESGARVFVATVASRLRDWPPFASVHRPDLTREERAVWEGHYRDGKAAAANDPTGAIEAFARAAALDGDFAELHYHWGQCALALGQDDVAREHLVLARDLDALRFRTDTVLNEAIREWAAGQKDDAIRLVDAERAFAEASPHGLPGDEWFHEHVHFTFPGNYHLARLFAAELESRLPAFVAASDPGNPDWLTEAECAARLAYGEGQRFEILRLLEARFQEGIYRQQEGHAKRTAGLVAALLELRGQAKPAGRRQSLALCRQALERAPDDWVLHELCARVLGGLEAYPEAVLEWEEVRRRIPHAARPGTEMGRLLQLQGRTEEALASFNRALEVNPDFAEAWVGRGILEADQGRTEAAVRDLTKALRIDPTRTEAQRRLEELGFRRP